jgi:hypothetical protein
MDKKALAQYMDELMRNQFEPSKKCPDILGKDPPSINAGSEGRAATPENQMPEMANEQST